MSAAAHKPFGGSGAKRWTECPSSIALQGKPGAAPDGTSMAAMGGTAAHKLAELSMLDGNPLLHVGTMVDVDGVNIAINAHMVEPVRLWQKTVKDYLSAKMPNASVMYEQKLDLGFLGDDVGGTADLVAFDESNGRLLVADYKHGKGVVVDADENAQGAFYILAAIKMLAKRGHEVRRATFLVVQPRAPMEKDRITWWFIPGAQAFTAEWAERFAKAIGIARIAMSDDAAMRKNLKAGSHCAFCRAVAICPAYRQAQGKELAPLFDAAPAAIVPVPSIFELSDEQIARVVEVESLIAKWMKAVKGLAVERLRTGKPVAGLKMVEGRSVRKWVDGKDDEIANAITDAGGVPYKLVGITEGQKVLHASQMESFCVKPKGKPTLALASDKRPALTGMALEFDDAEESES